MGAAVSPLQIVEDAAQRGNAERCRTSSGPISLRRTRALAEAEPDHLTGGLRTAAASVADRSWLTAWDAYSAGRIDDEFDYDGYFSDIARAFENRMYASLSLMPFVPELWPNRCARSPSRKLSPRGSTGCARSVGEDGHDHVPRRSGAASIGTSQSSTA